MSITAFHKFLLKLLCAKILPRRVATCSGDHPFFMTSKIICRLASVDDIISNSAFDLSNEITRIYTKSSDGLEEERAEFILPQSCHNDLFSVVASFKSWLDTVGILFGAYKEDILVGFAVYRPCFIDRVGKIEMLHVSKPNRCQGAGRELIQQIIDYATNESMNRLLVSCNCNKRAVDFFASSGFRVVSCDSVNLELHDVEPDSILMVRSFVQYKFRWCIMGTSYISGVMVDAIRASKNGEVYCVVGRTAQNVQTFTGKYGIAKSYVDYDEALADPLVDIVYIGLPTYLHAEWVQRCARAGKHVLNEKSFAVNSGQTQAALDVVKQNRVFCMEAQMYRCHPIILRLKEMVCVEKPLGAMRSVDATFSAPISDLYNRRAGGSILDLGCYSMSMIRLLCGEPESISGTGELLHPSESKRLMSDHSDSDRMATAVLKLSHGVIGTIRSCNDEELNVTLTLTFENGRIELSNLWDDSTPDEIRIYPVSISPGEYYSEIVPLPDGINFYVLQVNTVHRSIQYGRLQAAEPSMTWQDSLNNMKALDRWRASIGLNYSIENTVASL